MPLDADLMIDVRFLPNPYWEVELRPYSGDDPQVYHYVMDKPETQEFIKRLLEFLDYALRNMLRKARIISLWRLAVPAASIALFRSRISCMTTIKFNITVIKNTAISGN